MGYYTDIMDKIPQTEGNYPAYTLSIMQIARNADDEVAELKGKVAENEELYRQTKEDLEKAQQENIKLLSNENENESSESEEESDDIKSEEEILDGKLELDY